MAKRGLPVGHQSAEDLFKLAKVSEENELYGMLKRLIKKEFQKVHDRVDGIEARLDRIEEKLYREEDEVPCAQPVEYEPIRGS